MISINISLKWKLIEVCDKLLIQDSLLKVIFWSDLLLVPEMIRSPCIPGHSLPEWGCVAYSLVSSSSFLSYHPHHQHHHLNLSGQDFPFPIVTSSTYSSSQHYLDNIGDWSSGNMIAIVIIIINMTFPPSFIMMNMTILPHCLPRQHWPMTRWQYRRDTDGIIIIMTFTMNIEHHLPWPHWLLIGWYVIRRAPTSSSSISNSCLYSSWISPTSTTLAIDNLWMERSSLLSSSYSYHHHNHHLHHLHHYLPRQHLLLIRRE